MGNTRTRPSQQTITTAERLLTQTFGGDVRLDEGVDLGGSGRSGVYRFKVLSGPAAAPASVIVKQPRSTIESPDGPDSARVPAWTLNEWASSQFLDQIAPDAAFGPRFYGGERVTGLIAFEDLVQSPQNGEKQAEQSLSLPPASQPEAVYQQNSKRSSDFAPETGKRLDHFLLDTDPTAAEHALIEFAAAHGRMQALSIGRQAEFARIHESLGLRTENSGYYDYEKYEWLAPALHKTAELLAITPAPGIDGELTALRTAILHPDPFLAFIQRDSCPDNCLYTPSGIRLLDFEGGMIVEGGLSDTGGLAHAQYRHDPLPLSRPGD